MTESKPIKELSPPVLVLRALRLELSFLLSFALLCSSLLSVAAVHAGSLPPELGWYVEKPAEHEAMVAFPHAGHALEIGGDESGQIREGDHHGQGHPRTSDTETG